MSEGWIQFSFTIRDNSIGDRLWTPAIVLAITLAITLAIIPAIALATTLENPRFDDRDAIA